MMKNRLKKGFTIIELIVVIAVLGILVLLALPKFLGYTEKAKIAQVKNDIVAYEKAIDSKRTDNDKYIESWEKVDTPKMESIKKSLFNKKGLINDSNNATFEGEYYKVPKDNKLVKTNLKGDFYLGQGGEVYYYDENLANKILGKDESDGSGGENGDGQPPVTEPEPPVTEPEPPVTEKFTVTFKDYYGNLIEAKTVEKGQSVTPPLINPVTGIEIKKWNKDLTNIMSDLEVKPVLDGSTDKDLGYSDTDFSWIQYNYGGQIGPYGQSGYFQYTGTGKSTVEIPHVIQGVPVTTYYRMFELSPAEITKVISTNKNVKDVSYMFFLSKGTSLDLSEFDTSNVTDMSGMFHSSKTESLTFGGKFNTSNVENMYEMFYYSQAPTLNLSTFDTSNVSNMSSMFQESKATNINLSSFNTSKVTDMNSMFKISSATSLDLSSFDTSNVIDVTFMFQSSQATIGYAKTQEDVDKFNDSIFKPSTLTFKLK